MTTAQIATESSDLLVKRATEQANIDAAQKTMHDAQAVIDAAQAQLDVYAKRLAELAAMVPDDTPEQMTGIFTDAKGNKISALGNVTLDHAPAGVGVEGVSGTVTLNLSRPGWSTSKTLKAPPYFIANTFKANTYTLAVTVGGKTTKFPFTVSAASPVPSQPNTQPTPPVVQPPAPSKTSNTIAAADVAIKAGAVVVEEGFPFFLHTRSLSPASTSWVPNLPFHNFDFDWSMEGMARFGTARGRCYAGILPAGTHAGSLVITHPKSGASGKLALSVTVIQTPRRAVTVKSENELRSALAIPGTDAHLGADITLNSLITVASLTRLLGEGHKIISNVNGVSILQPKGADGFVMRDLTVNALTNNDTDVFFSPNGTRAAAINIIVDHAVHFVNANGKPRGLLIEDVRTKDGQSIKKYLVWNDAIYAVLRGLWCDDSLNEHCVRGSPVCAAYERCYLTNVNRVSVDPNDTAKGTITAHCAKDLSIDLCSCGRDGDQSRGGDIGTGPLVPVAANTPADQLTAERISITRTFMRKGAVVAIRAGTIGCRVQDCKTDFTTWSCFGLSDGPQKGLQNATDVSFVNDGVGADPTPKWNNKIVVA